MHPSRRFPFRLPVLLCLVASTEAFVGGAVVRSAAGAGLDLYMAEPAMPALRVIATALHRAADVRKRVFILFHFVLLLSGDMGQVCP